MPNIVPGSYLMANIMGWNWDMTAISWIYDGYRMANMIGTL